MKGQLSLIKAKFLILILLAFFTQLNFAQLPDFNWAKKGDFNAKSITYDAAGNVYTTGSFKGTVDFDPSALGVYNLTGTPGSSTIFVLKLNSSGGFVWAKAFVPAFNATSNVGKDIKVDNAGNVFTIGFFTNNGENPAPNFGSVDFDPGPGIYSLVTENLPFNQSSNYISKLDADGNFVGAIKIVAGIESAIRSMALDNSGNILVAGIFNETVDFNPSALGVFNLTSNGGYDCFILKLSTNLTFQWVKQFGGAEYDEINDLTIDNSGNLLTTGNFTGTVDFNPSLGVVYNLISFNNDAFILKLTSAGNFVWAKATDGTLSSQGKSIEIDALGAVYTIGFFSGLTDFDPSAVGIFNLNSSDGNTYILKLDVSGNFVWAGQLNAINTYYKEIAVDALNNLYISAESTGATDYDPGVGVFTLATVGSYDKFTLKLNTAGNFVWVFKAGGGTSQEGADIAIDNANNIYTTGPFKGTVDFNPEPGVFNLSAPGTEVYAFITKFNQSAVPLPISLLSFTAEINNDNVDLNWVTASEINNDFFTVERSYDGRKFDKIADIQSNGNSNEKTEYTFIDKTALSTTLYYRLKQTDLDGRCKYSSIVSVQWSKKMGEFTVFPNPITQGKFSLNLTASSLVSIIDAQGKIVDSQRSYNAGNHIVNFEKQPGVYFIKLEANGKIQIQKLVNK